MSTLSKADTNSAGRRTSRIIKAVDVSTEYEAADTLKRAKLLSSVIEKQAHSDAQVIVENAEKQAAAIIEKAENDCREMIQRVQHEALEDANRSASEYLLELTTDLQAQLASLDSQLINLVGTALEKIIGEIDETDRIEKAISKGLTELKERHGLILLVHASQYDAAQVAVSRFHSFVGHEKGPIHRVDIDADLKPEECMLLSSGGLLDISLKTQINSITEGLLMRHQGAE